MIVKVILSLLALLEMLVKILVLLWKNIMNSILIILNEDIINPFGIQSEFGIEFTEIGNFVIHIKINLYICLL